MYSSIEYWATQTLATNTHRPRSFNLTIAHMYSICLIPNLFSYAILQSLTHYFQTQESSPSNALLFMCNSLFPYSPLLGSMRDGWCIRDFMQTSLWSRAISKIGIFTYSAIISHILNWRLWCFRYVHAVSQLLICTTTYHMDLRQQQGLQRFIVAVTLFFCHGVLVYAFRSKKEIADMDPLLCLSIVIFQALKARERIFVGDN
ncbi:hypothetical protein CFP56_011273 [Quercus suber]|uniref:GPI mannosyltransferase 2 n=1 Tax=Quercus suber TaxID=58331 RepID=A0AAW0MCN1_QUESU